MTYRITHDGEHFTDCETARSLLAFISHHINGLVDGVYCDSDGNLIVRMAPGYKIQQNAPKVVRLPNRGVVNAEDKPA